MYSLPGPTILRARKERILLVPGDVMYEGDMLQKLGMPIPDELVAHCANDGVRIYEEDGDWYAEPLSVMTSVMSVVSNKTEK